MARTPFKCEIPGCANDDATDQCESCGAWLCSSHATYFAGLPRVWWCVECGSAEADRVARAEAIAKGD